MVCNERITKSRNGCFERLFHWDKELLKSLCDGFLIQKVARQSTVEGRFNISDRDKNVFNHTYYEAWKLENGSPIYEDDTNTDFDDRWLYSISDFLDPLGAVLKDYASKYKSSGTVTMTGMLFLVPKDHPLTQSIMSSFSSGKVPFAGDLLSAYDCAVENHFHPIYEHHFAHGWKLDEDNEFISVIVGEMRKQRLSLEECKSYLKPCFSDLPIYKDLRRSILQDYETEG